MEYLFCFVNYYLIGNIIFINFIYFKYIYCLLVKIKVNLELILLDLFFLEELL